MKILLLTIAVARVIGTNSGDQVQLQAHFQDHDYLHQTLTAHHQALTTHGADHIAPVLLKNWGFTQFVGTIDIGTPAQVAQV